MNLNKDTVTQFHCPRWSELPGISLYMDQVVIYLDDILSIFVAEDEKAVTSTMINNYVKQKLIEPPQKKKYGKGHIASLIILSIMKKVLTMTEITGLMSYMAKSYGNQQAYDMFCEKLEQVLVNSFDDKKTVSLAFAWGNEASDALDAALDALIGKLVLQTYLAQISPKDK